MQERPLEFPRLRESENFVQALSAGLDANMLSDTSSQKNCTIYRRRIQDDSKKMYENMYECIMAGVHILLFRC